MLPAMVSTVLIIKLLLPVCGDQFVSDSGNFQSPSLSRGYNSTVYCTWTLPQMASSNTTIAIYFQNLKTFNGPINGTEYDCNSKDVVSLQMRKFSDGASLSLRP